MIYHFNYITIDSNNFKLQVKGTDTQVEPQVFNLILYLIKNKDKVVSRDELLDQVWQGRMVSDTSINNSIKSARKVLGDDGNKQQVIKTVHSRGYQFVADIQSTENTFNKALLAKRFGLYISVITVVFLLLLLFINYYRGYELKQSVQKIANYQENLYLTFVAQAKRRNELVDMIETRIGEQRAMQFEKYFSYYFDKLNAEEKFVFEQIRGMTEIGLYQNNQNIINELNNNPQIITQIPGTKELQQHLEFWLNKYHSVFKQRQDMCLLYVGVEDGVPYPSEVNDHIKTWLENHN